MNVPAMAGLDLNTQEGRADALQRYFHLPSDTNDVAALKPELLAYGKDDTLVVRFRPQKWQLNGMNYVQGGFLVSMIDVVLGPLAAVYAGGDPSGTINLSVDYFRPVTMEDAFVTVVAHVINNTKRVIHMEAELLKSNGKAAVKVSTNVMKDNE